MKKLLCFALVLCCILTGCQNLVQVSIIKLDDYKNITVPTSQATVSEEEVENKINEIINNSATIKKLKRKAKKGDAANITITEDGKKESQTMEITLGSSSMVKKNGKYKGFDEQIIGHKPKEKFDITVKYPKTGYHISNKTMTYHTVLNSLTKRMVPELTNDWVKKNSKVSDSVEAYHLEIKTMLEEEQKKNAKDQKRINIKKELLSRTQWTKKPIKKIEKEKNSIIKQYKDQAKKSGMSYQDYMNFYFGNMDYELQIEKQAEDNIMYDEIIKYIADKENITLSDKTYQKMLKEKAIELNYSNPKDLEKKYGKEELTNTFLETIIIEKLY